MKKLPGWIIIIIVLSLVWYAIVELIRINI